MGVGGNIPLKEFQISKVFADRNSLCLDMALSSKLRLQLDDGACG